MLDSAVFRFLLFFYQMQSGKNAYETGEIVPETGIYRVVHSAHRLPHEVVILKDEHFPRCCKCSGSVFFSLVHAAPELFWRTVYHVYELPIIEDDAAATGA
jgi:hypothetical protein